MGLFSKGRQSARLPGGQQGVPGGQVALAQSASGAPGQEAPGQARPGRAVGFEYLSDKDIYLDSACQTLRPQQVIAALNDYYLNYNSCGERVKYDWGKRLDAEVAQTREAVLARLNLNPKQYDTSFTLNTTFGLNLLQQQLPLGRFSKVVTTHAEHNSVFLSTMSAARRLNVPRILLERDTAGQIRYSEPDLAGAIVVVSAMDNVFGAPTQNLPQLVADVRRLGGITIVDAAQAAAHAPGLLQTAQPDAICFSAHKLYGASLGVVAASTALLDSLDLSFLGGGQVASVHADSYELLAEPHARLEPGLQAWGEIVALRAALNWLNAYSQINGESPEARTQRLALALHDGLSALPKLRVLSPRGSTIVTVLPEKTDGHQLATFMAKGNVMVRSGYFCAHHWIKDVLGLPPLVRFSLGAHNPSDDVARALEITGRLVKGL